MANSPMPWFYTIEAVTGRTRNILRDNTGEMLGIVDRTEDIETIVDHSRTHDALKAVLLELVKDVEAVGKAHTRKDWPDLFQTYLKAKQLLK